MGDYLSQSYPVEGDNNLVLKSKEVPLQAANFDTVREGNCDRPPLETFPDFFSSDQYRQYCFDETKKAWIYQFDGKHIAQDLGGVPSSEKLRYLRQIRKFGSILMNVYKFVSVGHKPPKKLKDFVFDLGQHNDRYFTPAREKAALKILNSQSEWNLLTDNLPVELASKEDFQQYTRTLLVEIQTLIGAERLIAKDFHYLRRQIRQCANLAQTPAVEHIGEGPQWLFLKLDELSKVMGKKHDSIVKKHLSEAKCSKLEIQLEPDWKTKFQEALPFFERLTGLNKD